MSLTAGKVHLPAVGLALGGGLAVVAHRRSVLIKHRRMHLGARAAAHLLSAQPHDCASLPI